MVVLTPAEVARINHEARLRILEYVLAKGVKPRDLGVTSSLLTKIKHSYRSVSDALLIAALRFMPPDEFRAVMGEPEAVVLWPGGLSRLSQAEKAFVARVVVRDPELRSLIRSYLRGVEREDLDKGHMYTVTKRQLEDFVRVLKARGMSPSTLKDRVGYLDPRADVPEPPPPQGSGTKWRTWRRGARIRRARGEGPEDLR